MNNTLVLSSGAVIQSGNVVELDDGSVRKIIQLPCGKFVFLWENANSDAYADAYTYTDADTDAYTGSYWSKKIVRVYEGLNDKWWRGWTHYKETKVLWEKKTKTEVLLHAGLTATVYKDGALIDGWNIPIDKIKEILSAHESLTS